MNLRPAASASPENLSQVNIARSPDPLNQLEEGASRLFPPALRHAEGAGSSPAPWRPLWTSRFWSGVSLEATRCVQRPVASSLCCLQHPVTSENVLCAVEQSWTSGHVYSRQTLTCSHSIHRTAAAHSWSWEKESVVCPCSEVCSEIKWNGLLIEMPPV